MQYIRKLYIQYPYIFSAQSLRAMHCNIVFPPAQLDCLFRLSTSSILVQAIQILFRRRIFCKEIFKIVPLKSLCQIFWQHVARRKLLNKFNALVKEVLKMLPLNPTCAYFGYTSFDIHFKLSRKMFHEGQNQIFSFILVSFVVKTQAP